MIEDYSRNNGILPLLAIIVCIVVAIVIKDGWVLPILLFIIFCVYHIVVTPTASKNRYKKRRKEYDKKIINFKPYVNESLTDETKKKIYDDYKYDPKKLFHNTTDGRMLFYTLKKHNGYPKGAIPDPDSYENNYVVGNIIELTSKNPKHKQYNIEYKGMVYELDGGYYQAECLENRMPTIENVKMYGYGGTRVRCLAGDWISFERMEAIERMKKSPHYVGKR